jgi:5-methylcytosine-specific restriction protein A
MPSLPKKKYNNTFTGYIRKNNSDEQRFRNSKAWKQLKLYKKSISPICEICVKFERIVPMTDVDHIKPISEGGQLYDIDNLQSLCKQCHSRKTMREINNRRYGAG